MIRLRLVIVCRFVSGSALADSESWCRGTESRVSVPPHSPLVPRGCDEAGFPEADISVLVPRTSDGRRAHNPKVVGSNPTPATNQDEGLAAKTASPFVFLSENYPNSTSWTSWILKLGAGIAANDWWADSYRRCVFTCSQPHACEQPDVTPGQSSVLLRDLLRAVADELKLNCAVRCRPPHKIADWAPSMTSPIAWIPAQKSRSDRRPGCVLSDRAPRRARRVPGRPCRGDGRPPRARGRTIRSLPFCRPRCHLHAGIFDRACALA